MRNILNFKKPETAGEWIIFCIIAGVALSHPRGIKELTKEIKGFIDENNDRKKITAREISKSIYQLKKRKIIRFEENNGKTTLIFDEKGKRKRLEYIVDSISIKNESAWDGRWRVLTFDIPEKEKSAREALRLRLRNIGFLQFQKSVWIYPYPCKEEMDFLTEYLHIPQYVNLFTATIEEDKPLRSHFKLSS